MTPAQQATLKWFKADKLRHPELCDYPFFVFLDSVREEYGFPLVLTNDARTPVENAALEARGAAPNSRHLAGQAVDIAFPATANHLWQLVAAIVKCQRAIPVELEIVHGPTDRHVHLAWLPQGRASSLEVALD